MARPSKFLEKSYPYLVVLLAKRGDKELHKHLLRSEEILKSLCELALNLVLENVQLTAAEKHKLRKYKKEILQLIRTRDLKGKYNLLTRDQQGAGLVSTLLSIGLPALASLLFTKK